MANPERTPQNPEIFARPHEHSVSMSKRLLSGDWEGKGTAHTVANEVDSSVKEIFYHGSLADRGNFWKEKASQKAYGEQMHDWLGSTTAWLNGLKNNPQGEVVLDILKHGLGIGNDRVLHDVLRQDPRLSHFIETKINSDLPADARLNLQTMDNTTLEVLDMYYKYLLPKNGHDVQESMTTQLLGDLLTGIVKDKSGKQLTSDGRKEIEGRLEAIAPFLRIAGVNAQHGLGAMLAAEVDAQTNYDEVNNATVEKEKLSQADNNALNFFQKAKKIADENIRRANAESGVDGGEMGEGIPLVDYFNEVTDPPARKEDSKGYWIDGKISTADEVLAELTPDQLKAWERIEPFWTFKPDPDAPNDKGRYMFVTNFKPAEVFEPEKNPDGRFAKVEGQTDGDSGLLALAGIAAETSEEQAKLFNVLGRVVLQAYNVDQNLLEKYLNAQLNIDARSGMSSLRQFAQFEIFRAKELLESEPQIQGQIFQRLGIDMNGDIRKQLTEKQKDPLFLRAYDEILTQQALAYGRMPFGEGHPEKLLILAEAPTIENGFTDIPATVAQWKQRLDSGELEKALASGNLTLEQIRQIEFLSHAVRIADKDGSTVIKWLQERAKNTASTQNPEPVEPQKPADGGEHSALETAAKIASGVVGAAEAAHEAHQHQRQQDTAEGGESQEKQVNLGGVTVTVKAVPAENSAESGNTPIGGGEPAPVIPASAEMDTMESSIATENLGRQELGEQLADKAKTLEDVETWQPARQISKLHEDTYSEQILQEDSELIKNLEKSLAEGYGLTGEVMSFAVNEEGMKSILQTRGIAASTNDAEVFFMPGFGSLENVNTNPQEKNYLVVVKKEGQFANASDETKNTATIPLESVAGLYRIETKEGSGWLVFGRQKEVTITQLLPGTEQESQRPMTPPPASGSGTVRVAANTQAPQPLAAGDSQPDTPSGPEHPTTPGSGVLDRVEHGFDIAKQFEKDHPLLTKAGIAAALIIGDALYAHLEAKKARERAQDQDVLEVGIGRGDIVPVMHATEESYNAAKNKADAAEKMLREYRGVRSKDIEESGELDRQLHRKGLDQSEYENPLPTDKADPELLTLHHIDKDNINAFDEQVIVFIQKSESGEEAPLLDPYTNKPLYINRAAFERKVAKGRTNIGMDGRTAYDVPRFDDKGELIGVYYLTLTPEQADFLNQQKTQMSAQTETRVQQTHSSSAQVQRRHDHFSSHRQAISH